MAGGRVNLHTGMILGNVFGSSEGGATYKDFLRRWV